MSIWIRRASTASGKLVWSQPTQLEPVALPLKGAPKPPAPKPPPKPPVPPKPEPQPMPDIRIPIEVLSTVTVFVKRFPLPNKHAGESQSAYENRLRAYIKKMAEQVEYDHGGDVQDDKTVIHYGQKNAGGGRPTSKDGLARATFGPDDDEEPIALVSWDMLIGAGTGKPTLADNPAAHEILSLGQEFEDVFPVDHLGGIGVPPIPPTPQPPKPPAGPTYDEGVETARLCAAKWGALHLAPEDQGRNLVDAGQMFQWCYRMFREGWTRERIVNDVK